MKIPFQFFLDFCKATTLALGDFPSRDIQAKIITELTIKKNPDEEITSAVSLDIHQKYLLQVQLEILQQVVNEFNQKQLCEDQHGELLTIELVQQYLLLLVDPSTNRKEIETLINIDSESNSFFSLDMFRTHNMFLMNQAARVAFVRSILCIETQLEQKQHEQSVDQDGRQKLLEHFLEKSHIIQFCALIKIAISTYEVGLYSCLSADVLFENTPWSQIPSILNHRINTMLEPDQRIIHIQSMLLRAMGFHPESALKDLESWINHGHSMSTSSTDTLSESDKVLLKDKLLDYVSCIRVATSNAILHATSHNPDLSDHDQGGVTRIVSVTYSEKDIGSSLEDVPPKIERMEEHNEEMQREALTMAKKAATLEQSILNELLTMGESDREELLEVAKNHNDAFMSILQRTKPGPDRVWQFQRIDPDVQRLLIMYSLWQKQKQ